LKKILTLVIISLLLISIFSVLPLSVKACPLFLQENAVFLTNMNVSSPTHRFYTDQNGMPMLPINSTDNSFDIAIEFYLSEPVTTFLKIFFSNTDGAIWEVYRVAYPPFLLSEGWNSITVTLPMPGKPGVYTARIVGVAGHRDDDGIPPWEGIEDWIFGFHPYDWNVTFGDGFFIGRTAEELDWDVYEIAYQFGIKVCYYEGHNPYIYSLTLTPSTTTLNPEELFTLNARYYRAYYCPSDYFKVLYKNEATGEITEAGRWAAGYWQMVPYGWQTFTLILRAPNVIGKYTVKVVGCSGHGTQNYFGVDWTDKRSDGGFVGHAPEEMSWDFYEISAEFSIYVGKPFNPWGDDDNDGILNFLESIAQSPYNIQSLAYYSNIGFNIGTYQVKVGGGFAGFADPFNTYDEITSWAITHVTTTERTLWDLEVGNIVGIIFLEISKDLLTTLVSLIPKAGLLLGALATFAPECSDGIVRFALLVNVHDPTDINTLLEIIGPAPQAFVSLFLDIWFLNDESTLPDGFKFTRIPELTLDNFVDALGYVVFEMLLGKIAGMLKGLKDVVKTIPELIKQFFIDIIWSNLFEKFIKPGVEFIEIQGRRLYNYIATRIDSAFRDIDLQLYVDGNLILGGPIVSSGFGFYSGDAISSEYILVNATDLANHRVILVINGTEVEMFGEEYVVLTRVMQRGLLVNEQSFIGTIDPGQIFVSAINITVGPQGELIATMSQPILMITIDSWITDSDFYKISEFRVVFTPDRKTGYYTLTATNPGQFYFNVLVNNNGPLPLNITIFYSIDSYFIMKAARPIHIYADMNRIIDITPNCTISGNTITVYNVPPGSFIYVTIHIDYLLKNTTGYTTSQVNSWYSEHIFVASTDSVVSSATITAYPKTI
jgi:hypothetical protein